MVETSGRLLRLLALLQTHGDRSGAELAERLGVSRRTVRRDVERLRELGYPVRASRGSAGYRLGAGARLPPLLLDDEEAVAVVVGLRTAAGGSVAGIEESSLRALAKLEQVLPSRLRHRVGILHAATVRAGTAPGPEVSPDTLMAVAEACRRRERLRFDYAAPRGGAGVRSVEPHSLVSFDRHWYLVAWDTDRGDWRTFRVDRLTPRTPTGPRFAPREPPEGDVAAYVARRLSWRAWRFQATVTLHESAEAVADRVWPGMGVVEPLDDHSCLLHLGADTPRDLAWMVTSVDAGFTLTHAPPELAEALRVQGTRCLDAVRAVRPDSAESGGAVESQGACEGRDGVEVAVAEAEPCVDVTQQAISRVVCPYEGAVPVAEFVVDPGERPAGGVCDEVGGLPERPAGDRTPRRGAVHDGKAGRSEGR